MVLYSASTKGRVPGSPYIFSSCFNVRAALPSNLNLAPVPELRNHTEVFRSRGTPIRCHQKCNQRSACRRESRRSTPNCFMLTVTRVGCAADTRIPHTTRRHATAAKAQSGTGISFMCDTRPTAAAIPAMDQAYRVFRQRVGSYRCGGIAESPGAQCRAGLNGSVMVSGRAQRAKSAARRVRRHWDGPCSTRCCSRGRFDRCPCGRRRPR